MGTVPAVPYTFRARLKHLADGDTQTYSVDFRAHRYGDLTIRVLGINTPEVVGPERAAGLAAAAWALTWLSEAEVQAPGNAWPLVLETQLDANDKYGRLLANVYRVSDGAELGQALIAAGHAVPWDGHGPRPVPQTVRKVGQG